MKNIDNDEIEDEPLENDIKELLSIKGMPPVDLQHSRQKTVRRVKANTAQRDTMLFAIVKIWSTIAEMLAPIFAALSAKNASHLSSTSAKSKEDSKR